VTWVLIFWTVLSDGTPFWYGEHVGAADKVDCNTAAYYAFRDNLAVRWECRQRVST